MPAGTSLGGALDGVKLSPSEALQQGRKSIHAPVLGSPGVLSGALVEFGGLKIETYLLANAFFSSPIIFLDFSPRRPSYHMSAFSYLFEVACLHQYPAGVPDMAFEYAQ